MIRRTLSLLALAPLLVSSCTSGGDDRAFPVFDRSAPPELALRLQLAANLEPFDDCAQVLDYFRSTARELGAANVVAGGFSAVHGDVAVPFPGGSGSVGVSRRAIAVAEGQVDAVAGGAAGADEGAASVPAAAPVPGDTGPGFSGTNVQEAGVDEPDLAKTDGRLVVTVAQGRLQVVDPSGGGRAPSARSPCPRAATSCSSTTTGPSSSPARGRRRWRPASRARAPAAPPAGTPSAAPSSPPRAPASRWSRRSTSPTRRTRAWPSRPPSRATT